MIKIKQLQNKSLPENNRPLRHQTILGNLGTDVEILYVMLVDFVKPPTYRKLNYLLNIYVLIRYK